MNPNGGIAIRRLPPLAAMVPGSACIPETVGGPALTSQVVYVTATGDSGRPEGSTPSPTIESILDLTPTWTLAPEPANTATTAPVTMTAGQALSCAKSPHRILYEWVAGIAEGETVTLMARSTADWPDYFYVRTSGGKECWAFGEGSTFIGNIYSLSEKKAPPLPEIILTIRNKMYLPITDLYIRAMDETSWGANRLGANQIKIGATFQLPLTAGYYDLQIKDQYGGVLLERLDTPIVELDISRDLRIEPRFTVVIRNESSDALCRIAADASGGPTSNMTVQGNGIIAPGEDASIKVVAGHYDLILHRCMDDVARFLIVSKYIGPLSTMIVLSDRIALP